MPKEVKSQWDFGELFPPEATRQVLSVGELTLKVRRLLESSIGSVWVTGEISNLRLQSSGHAYFTLKDSEAQLSCVLFRNEGRESRNLLADGRKVVLRGELTVYEPRGQYQLRVLTVELQGLGALQAAFEQLKQKLNAEGLFAQERKRPIPRFVRRMGLVTSPTGAAIRDVLHCVERRNPALEMILAPCRVQGDGAANEIARAIRLLNEFAVNGQGLDLILVTRGGGSLEDLWPFNEEVVARAVAASALPVISGVGHEIDFTICDFVADLRAATPSAAAELITEGIYQSIQFLGTARNRMRGLLGQVFGEKEDEFAAVRGRLMRMHPRRRMDDWLQRLDDLRSTLSRCTTRGMRERALGLRLAGERLRRVRPALELARRKELVQLESSRLHELMRHQFQKRRDSLAALQARLRLLGPEQVLARGYSITMKADTGELVRDPAQAKPGEKLKTKLKGGELRSVVSKRD